jgi:ABC-type branched-subunit amino acid transport system substrate-binding protein
LLAGLELGVREVNQVGGFGGRPLELVVRDTAADPQRAVTAVDELSGLGVAALAGEYHSVVPRAAAGRADALGLPFLCSSAVLDALTEKPTEWVARLSPPQSRGWQVYADFLLSAGHRRIAVAVQPSVYWATGTSILPPLPQHAHSLAQPVDSRLAQHNRHIPDHTPPRPQSAPGFRPAR